MMGRSAGPHRPYNLEVPGGNYSSLKLFPTNMSYTIQSRMSHWMGVTHRSLKASASAAHEAYRAANYDRALELIEALLRRDVDVEQLVLLRARTRLKRNAADALTELLASAAKLHSRDARGIGELLQGVAFVRLEDQRSAAARFKAAAALLPKTGPLRAELHYQRAAAAWIARDLSGAEQSLARIEIENAGDDLRPEIGILRGAIAASRGDISLQAAVLLEVIDMLDRVRAPQIQHVAHVVSQIASLARELPSEALRDAALARIDAVPWTADTAEYHFIALRSMAWRHALDGDEFRAFRRLKDAAAAAPSTGWRVVASCDRASLADALGERRWAAQELRDADELAQAVDWRTLRGEERFALLSLAELHATADPTRALAFIARYRESGKVFSPVLASAADRRVGAQEAYALGIVQAARGDRSEATRLLLEAWNVYDDIGYVWRATRAALGLFELTSDKRWHERAASRIVCFPRSWLARGQVGPEQYRGPEVERLTPAQRGVFDLLVQGRSTTEIAAERSISPFTVRNHVKAVLHAFDVPSRPALLARVQQAAALRRAPVNERSGNLFKRAGD